MNFQSEAHIFLEKLNLKLNEFNVFLEPHWSIDHLCYRTSTLDRYNELKKEFLTFSKLLIESDVNGRPISTFKLDKPVYFENSSISVVELPAPKVGKVTPEGFEHIEVVCDISFEDLESRYKNLKIDKSGLKKDLNQEFELCFGEVNLKFHQLSLESVINLEGNSKIWSAIKKSEVLSILKEFKPLIAGTFPLGLQTEDSDLDILIKLADKTKLIDLAKKTWGSQNGFTVEEKTVDKLETVIIRFNYDEVPFEIFAQDKEPIRQKAYLHFLVEERLLKEVGKDFRNLVLRLRKQGLKTEPAFAQALNLTGDPFEELLELQKKPI